MNKHIITLDPTIKPHVYTEKDFKDKGYREIENDYIEDVQLDICGHFGNIVGLKLVTSKHLIMTGCNNTANIGYIVRFLTEFFDRSDDDGVSLDTAFRHLPIRIIPPHAGRPIREYVIGHFMKDRFVNFHDLMQTAIVKEETK